VAPGGVAERKLLYYDSCANCNRKIAVISQVQLFDTTSWYSRYHAVLSGPCPRNVNNRTVKNTQGDHVLCTSCTDVRFPATRTSTNLGSVVNSSKDVDTRYDTAMDTGQCSESCNYQRAEPSTDHHDRESTTRKWLLYMLSRNIKREQYGITSSALGSLVKLTKYCWTLLIKLVGSVRNVQRRRLNKLQVALTRTHEELVDMRVSLAWLVEQIENIKTNSSKKTNIMITATDPTQPVNHNIPPSDPPSHLSTHSHSENKSRVTTLYDELNSLTFPDHARNFSLTKLICNSYFSLHFWSAPPPLHQLPVLSLAYHIWRVAGSMGLLRWKQITCH